MMELRIIHDSWNDTAEVDTAGNSVMLLVTDSDGSACLSLTAGQSRELRIALHAAERHVSP